MDVRTEEQRRAHYLIEHELAARLKCAGREERRALYASTYLELYSRVPSIPRAWLQSDFARAVDVARLSSFLEPFVAGKHTFLEIGPGDFQLTLKIARLVPSLFAVDVTDEVKKSVMLPDNVTFLVSDGCSIPLKPSTVDVAFSDQVMEHLHPEDAREQLRSILEILAPGGTYICITPNRLYGPHDVSRYFEEVASGLHLKEYAVHEVVALFREAGFKRTRTYTSWPRIPRLRVPVPLVRCVEKFLDCLPRPLSRGLACSAALRWLLRSRVIGTK